MTSWKVFLIELVLYTVLLLLYFLLVLHYLGGWFKELFDHHRNWFAVTALLVMITQAVGLEVVSSFLLKFIQEKRK